MKIIFYILLYFFCKESIYSQTKGYVLWNADGTMLIPNGSVALQPLLVSGATIKTVNGSSIIGSGNLVVTGDAAAWGAISGTLANQSDLQTALNTKQSSIAQGTTLQYFRGDFSLSTFPTTTASFVNSLNKNFVTDAQLVIVGNILGVNTGDNSANSTYASDYRAANFIAGTSYLAPSGNGSSLTGLTKTQVSLGNVDNTSDASKPISTAEQTALNLKANIASPTFTGTVAGITASMVGLGSVDNTSDAGKPVSTAEQTALNLKANIASPTFTGTVGGITASMVGLGNVTNESKATMFTSPTFTGTTSGITATMVGLANVTNESKATMFTSPTFTGTVSGVTATMISLGNVTNESKTTMFTSPTFTGTVTLPASTSLTTPVIGAATGTSLAATGAITSSGTAGIGYATGAGGTVTQLTSKSTTVILNKVCGTITTNNAALAAATIVTFTVTNSAVAANDVVVVQHDSGGTIGSYTLATNTSAAGSFKISIRNNTAGSLGEALVIKYIIIKSAIN